MGKITQKILSILLATTMAVGVFTILPEAAKVRADETEITVHVSGEISNTSNPKNDINMADTGVTKTTWILDGDVTFASGRRAKVQNGEFILDLNGHTWTAVDKGAAIALAKHTSMTIIDSSPEKTGKIVGSNETIIDVSKGGDNTIIIDGVQIEGGTNFITYSNTDEKLPVSLTIENSTIKDCSGTGNEAIIKAYEGSSLTITNCEFVNCSSKGTGGAIRTKNYNASITGTSFTDCRAVNGGAIYVEGNNDLYHVTVSNCTFSGNIANEKGGAIYLKESSTTDGCVLENVTISGNEALTGSGIYCTSSINKFVLKGNNYIFNNTSDNLYLTTSSSKPRPITIEGELTGCVGITTSTSPTSSKVVVFTSGFGTGAGNNVFISDNPNYTAVVTNGEVVMKNLKVFEESSIECGTSISLIYYVNVPTEDQTDGTTFTYTVNGTNTTLNWSDHVEINNRIGFRIKVKATEMTCPIEAEIHLGVSDATSMVSEHTFKDVAEAYINNSDMEQKFKTLAEALLIYGGCAQRQFNSENVAADQGITNNDSKASAISDMFAQESSSGRMATISSTDEGIRYYGSTLFFLSDNTLRHYFYISGDVSDYTFEFGGESKTPTRITGTNFYYIQIAGLAPADFHTAYNVTVKASGSSVISFEYSAITYLAKIYDNPTSATMQALAYATAYYVASCDDI